MNEQDRSTCASLAALLDAGGQWAQWGPLLAAVAALALALAGPGLNTGAALGCGATVLLALPERYLAVRLRLDERLFQGLAQGAIASLPALDAALAQLQLRAASGTVRPLDERVRGTRRWLRCHAALVAGQSLLLFAALLAQRIA